VREILPQKASYKLPSTEESLMSLFYQQVEDLGEYTSAIPQALALANQNILKTKTHKPQLPA